MIKPLLWLLFINFVAYLGVTIAMVWGWGLWPKSWLWVTIGYFLAGMTWPCLVAMRIRLSDALKKEAL